LIARRWSCLFALFAVATIAPAADPQGTPRSRRTVLWPSVESPPALELNGVRLLVDGRPAQPLRLDRPSDDLLLFVVLDLTGDLTLIGEARDALEKQLRQLLPNALAAVLSAQDGLRVLLDPTSDRERSIEAIHTARTTGAAGLLESLEPASRLAARVLARAPVRLAVLYVTDSNVYNYREDYTNPVINYSDSGDLSRRFPDALIRDRTVKLAAAMLATDVPIFIVHLAYLRDRLNEAYQTGLQQIAEATGGAASFCRSPGDIAGEIASAFRRITTHYALDFAVPPGAPQQFTIQLEAPPSGFNLRTRFAAGPK
jgi:hypothetical protein